MEHTATANDLTVRGISAAQSNRRTGALSGVSTTTWVLLIQAACCISGLLGGGTAAFADAATYLGIAASVAGIHLGLRLGRQGARLRGLNCAVASLAPLFFWIIRLLAREIAL